MVDKPEMDLSKDDHFIDPDALNQVPDEQYQLIVEKPTLKPTLPAALIAKTIQAVQDEPAHEPIIQQQHGIEESDDKPENPPGLDDEGTLLQGEVQVRELIKKGYDLFLVVGVEGSGKTQLLDSFERHIQNAALSSFEKSDDGIRVDPTSPNTIKYLSINSTLIKTNKAAFIDAAGENFSGLYPQQGKIIAIKDVKLPKLVLPKLCGLILVIELDAYWMNTKPNQIKIVTWILTVFRWLIKDGCYDPKSPFSLRQTIYDSVNKMEGAKTRLDIPVQVLFSKADKLHKFSIPGYKNKLYPRQDSPFFLAYHHLPGLHHALLGHANYFRYDFVHSIVTNSKSIDEEEPCGVELSFQWLLNHRGKRSPRTVQLIEQQKRIDSLLFWRRYRWRDKSKLRA